MCAQTSITGPQLLSKAALHCGIHLCSIVEQPIAPGRPSLGSSQRVLDNAADVVAHLADTCSRLWWDFWCWTSAACDMLCSIDFWCLSQTVCIFCVGHCFCVYEVQLTEAIVYVDVIRLACSHYFDIWIWALMLLPVSACPAATAREELRVQGFVLCTVEKLDAVSVVAGAADLFCAYGMHRSMRWLSNISNNRDYKPTSV